MKRCYSCKQTLNDSLFSKCRTNSDGLYDACKNCTKKDYDKNRDEILLRKRNYYNNNKEKMRNRSKEYYHKNVDRIKKKNKSLVEQGINRKRMLTLRSEIFSVYGLECDCCGEKEILLLTIDHPNSDGNLHRLQLPKTYSNKIYPWLKKNGFPQGYRTLCINCNIARAQNHGICPHSGIWANYIRPKENLQMKQCKHCHRVLSANNFNKNKSTIDGMEPTCKECRRGRRIKIKQQVIDGYGGKCKCCGESIKEFLSLHHTNNDGAEHRKIVGNIKYWAIRNNFPDYLELMCYNCNVGAFWNNNICPHLLPFETQLDQYKKKKFISKVDGK